MPTVQGQANWARIHSPDKYDNYSVMVDVPDDFPKILKAGKIKAQCNAIDFDKESADHDKERMFCFNFKKSKFLRSGAEVPPPFVEDSQGNLIPPSILIGHGSEVIVQYHTYPYGEEGQSRLILDGIQVINLVKFVAKAREAVESEFEKVEGGYVADESGDI